MIQVSYDVTGNDVQYSRVFDDFGMRITDLRPAFEQIAIEFYQTMGQVFTMEGAFEGRLAWQPLSSSYARWKQRYFPGMRILHLTGRLEDSLTQSGHPDAIREIEPLRLVLGTRVPYAKTHQEGSGQFPQRKVIELTEVQKVRWNHIIHKYIFDLAMQTFGQERFAERRIETSRGNIT